MDYLKDIGLANSVQYLEGLVVRGRALRSEVDVPQEIAKLESLKDRLDDSKELMFKQRDSLKGILESVEKMEREIERLRDENTNILNQCMSLKGKRKQRNNLLLGKLENERRIQDLEHEVKKHKSRHLDDLSSLERMRENVDACQMEYDNAVETFKRDIGFNKDDIANLMVGIYNKFQDEILEHDIKKTRKQK